MTYHEILLNHLRSGRAISNMEAYALYRITCAGQRLGELRRGGLPIKDRWEESAEGKKYKVYYLESQGEQLEMSLKGDLHL